MDLVQMTTTTETVAAAERITDHLVERRLAACVQVTGPIRSTYRWNGSIEKAEEYMCIIKTRADLAAEVEAAIRSLHPYENPEIVAVPIVAGSDEYLEWVISETSY